MSKQDPTVNKGRNVNRTENQPQAPGQGGRMTEASPNPHNEQTIADSPVSTDQRDGTESQNVAGTPSTREGRLHPSVGESVGGGVGESVGGGVADTDSMFNEADPQAIEIGPSGTRAESRKKRESENPEKKKTA